MDDRSRPYVLHSDSECERLEKQAAMAKLADHLRHMKIPKGSKILDAGCGSGAMSRCFATHVADSQVVGVDLNPAYVTFARARAAAEGLKNIEFRDGNVLDLPFPDGEFDMVWSKYVLQWVANPEKAIAEFRRVTKPGGQIVCCNYDGFGVVHFPEDESLQARIMEVFPKLADYNIGRKTAPLFHQCGLTDIRVHFEPDSLFTVIGAIDNDRRENWIAQIKPAHAYVVKILGDEAAATEFENDFIKYYDRPDTASYTSLFFVSGRVP